jgi:hypothetical protein
VSGCGAVEDKVCGIVGLFEEDELGYIVLTLVLVKVNGGFVKRVSVLHH